MTVGVGIAGRMHSRGSVQRFYFQTCVVGKTGAVIVIVDIVSLLQGIAFECIGRFGYVGMTANFFKRADGDMFADDAFDFRKFVGVVCCKTNVGFVAFM